MELVYIALVLLPVKDRFSRGFQDIEPGISARAALNRGPACVQPAISAWPSTCGNIPGCRPHAKAREAGRSAPAEGRRQSPIPGGVGGLAP